MFLGTGQDITVPAWACFFSIGEYEKFIKLISSYFKDKSVTYCSQEGAVADINKGEYGFGKMGLLNLAQHCRLRPIAEWDKLVKDHFDGIHTAADFERQFRSKAHDFDQVKADIAVRIYPDEYVSAIEDGLVIGQQLAENVYAMLVFDFPNCVVNIRPEQTIQWGLTNEELFELGLKNVRKKYPLNISEQYLDGICFHLVVHDHFYSPDVLLMPEKMTGFSTEHGLLVGIPNRHAVLIHPIRNTGVLQAVHRMVPAIFGMYKDGPGSISEKLYWLSDGEFVPLPYTIDTENINLDPPPQFVELLHRLRNEDI